VIALRLSIIEITESSFWIVCTNVDLNLISDQRNFRAKYLKNGKLKEKVDLPHLAPATSRHNLLI